MYAIYKQMKYDAELRLGKDVTLYSCVKEEGFEVYDKGQWWKEIGRKDIEAIKIIEEPEGIFKDQGLKVKILEGKAIDEFLASVEE